MRWLALALVATTAVACGDDEAASMQMMEACAIICDCGFSTVPEVERCTQDCIKGPRYSEACNACIAEHDGLCTTIDDCDPQCQ